MPRYRFRAIKASDGTAVNIIVDKDNIVNLPQCTLIDASEVINNMRSCVEMLKREMWKRVVVEEMEEP